MIGQGNRISKPGDEFGAEGVAPAGSGEFPAFGDFGFYVGDEVRRHAGGGCQGFPAGYRGGFGLVLNHGDVQHQAELVLDDRMDAN
ncbi:MAG: hypothetical protein DLM68_06455 [Hyphomicrobiales bacterium]|nr:MAG: hypothetical protein DLM68_06455 [Hyphomicrobiales bacterium]